MDPVTAETVAAEETALDFGRVAMRTSARRELLLRNDGRGALTVTGYQFADSGLVGVFDYPAPPLTVGSGKQASLAITFRPPGAGVFSGSLQLVIAGGDRASLSVLLTGTGYHGDSPAFELAPPQLDFGDVEVTTSALRRLTLANVGVDVPGTSADNLRFAIIGEDGSLIEVAPAVTGPDAADFLVEWPPEGYRPEGLSEGQTIDVRLRFSPTSQGPKSATLIIPSNDQRAPSTSVPVTGDALPFTECVLDVLPPALDFGEVESNKHQDLAVAFINRNTEPLSECRILDLDLSPATRDGGAFVLPNGPLDEVVIPGGQRVVVPIRFAPKLDGRFAGELVFTTSDSPLAKPQTVCLRGIAAPSCLMLAPRELDFGTIAIGCASHPRVFVLYNTCSSSVTVTSMEILAGPTSHAFTITTAPPLPVTIAGGAQTDFAVAFAPLSDSGSLESGTLSIASTVGTRARDPDQLTLTGRGQPAPVRTDVGYLGLLPKIDVLFVVDDSSSMADKQASLASNLDSFAQYATQALVDYRIAVTTTDLSAAGAAGSFLPIAGANPRVVTASTPNPAQVLTQNLAVGSSGSETESLLRPFYLALADPLASGHNAGFYRDDAQLAVIIVSDAADQDPLATSISVYEDFLSDLKGPSRRYWSSVSAVIPTLSQPPAGCSYDTADAGLDTRVQQVVQDTHGILGDICDSGWGGAVARGLIPGGSGPLTFYLADTPEMTVSPDPIVVTVDGVRIDPTDSAGNVRWQYDPAHHAVDVDPSLARSLAGRTLTFSYQASCL